MQVNIGHFAAHKQEVLILLIPITYALGGVEHESFVEIRLTPEHPEFDQIQELLHQLESALAVEATMEVIADTLYQQLAALPTLAGELERERQLELMTHYRDCLD